jgi:hypothetical protein
MINITRLRKSDHWMDEHVCLTGSRCPDREFSMCPVHWIPRLEGYDFRPSKLVEMGPKLGGRVSQVYVVVVHQSINGLDLTTHIKFVCLSEEIFNGRVLFVASKDFLCFFCSIGIVSTRAS